MARNVAATGGQTTAVVAVFPTDGPGFIASAGDSSAYVADPHAGVRAIAPHDLAADGRVTDALGKGFRGGQVSPLSVGEGASVLLCTDGVDRMVRRSDFVPLLQASGAGLAGGIQSLMEKVLALGAPDNATVLVARRLG